MRATLILAEAASNHPDATITLLRAFWTRFPVEGFPFRFAVRVVARIECNNEDRGHHEFTLDMMAENGMKVAPTLSGKFDFDPSKARPDEVGQIAHLNFGLSTMLMQAGTYKIQLAVDGKVLADASAAVFVRGKSRDAVTKKRPEARSKKSGKK